MTDRRQKVEKAGKKSKLHQDYKVKPYDELDESTGELKLKFDAYGLDAEKYRITPIVNKDNIPQKAVAPFTRITRGATKRLTAKEKMIFYELTELVGWENNFVQGEDGSFLTQEDLTDIIGISRPTLSPLLKSLAEKQYIVLVDLKYKKYIYVNTRYVWFGFEKNRSDKVLDDFLAANKLQLQ